MESPPDSSPDVISAANSTSDGVLNTAGARLGDASRRVKPLASSAESVVVQAAHTAEVFLGHAIHLSARGLNRLDTYLIDRRDRFAPSPEALSTATDADSASNSVS